MSSRKCFPLLIFLVFIFIFNSVTEAVTYTYTQLDYPGVSLTFPSDINNSGHIVGEYHILDSYMEVQEIHGFSYNGSTYNRFDYPGSKHSIASGINDSGHIVGSYSNDDNPATSSGFFYNGSTFTSITYPGASLTAAGGINNSGVIVGFYSNDGGLTAKAFLYNGSTYTLIGPSASRTFAKDINDHGHIVGSYGNSSGTSLHGFLYDGSKYITIDYPGATYSMAFGINNSGHIVGSYSYTGIKYHGFLYDGSTYTTIDYPEAWSNQVSGINDLGQIVGDYGTGDEGIEHGFLVTPGDCSPGETRICDTGLYGICASGTQTCDSTGNWGGCIANIQPGEQEEICDCKDNNCDGQTDEGLEVCHMICLNSGWNLISLYLQPANTAIADVLGTAFDSCDSVWAFNNGWTAYYPAYPEYSDLDIMEAGWGYWLNMNTPATLTVSGNIPSNTISLVEGWNLVGYNSSTPLPIDKAIETITEDCESVWAYIDGGWKAYYPAFPEYSDLDMMSPNYGYWIKTTAECTWTLP